MVSLSWTRVSLFHPEHETPKSIKKIEKVGSSQEAARSRSFGTLFTIGTSVRGNGDLHACRMLLSNFKMWHPEPAGHAQRTENAMFAKRWSSLYSLKVSSPLFGCDRPYYSDSTFNLLVALTFWALWVSDVTWATERTTHNSSLHCSTDDVLCLSCFIILLLMSFVIHNHRMLPIPYQHSID